MQDYKQKNAQKGVQQNSEPIRSEMTNGIPNSALQDVMAGKRHADSSMMGHSQNLAPSIAAKMSQAFGMDLSGMQVYRSDAMAGSGMQGMASGNKVVLSSDVDLNTTAGQAILGHEISHIHAQSQGIGLGNSGLYENAALEHQADTEGMLAAQGKSIYSDGTMDMGVGMSYGLGMQGVEGMTTLGGGMSVSAGAPMQAKKGGNDEFDGRLDPNAIAYDDGAMQIRRKDMIPDRYEDEESLDGESGLIDMDEANRAMPGLVPQEKPKGGGIMAFFKNLFGKKKEEEDSHMYDENGWKFLR